MKTAVIGASGKMGTWFTRYFTEKGYETSIYDIDQKKLEKVASIYGAKQKVDIKSAISDADIILISVPIHLTAQIVADTIKIVKDTAVVVEIASLKENIINKMKKIDRDGITLISMHPMFGHGAKTLRGHKIVVVEVDDEENESNIITQLFPEAEIISTKAKEHDEAMAAILSLAHIVNFVFTSSLPEKDVEKIRRLAGTSFALQLTLAESILQDDPDFLAALQIDNTHAIPLINKLAAETEYFRSIVAEKDRKKMIMKLKHLQKIIKKDKNYDDSYRRIYQIMDTLKGL